MTMSNNCFTIPIIDDSIIEQNETIVLMLSSNDMRVNFGISTTVLTIIGNEGGFMENKSYYNFCYSSPCYLVYI